MTNESYNNMNAPADRWYVLGLLTIVYALNIADRYAISTLIGPIGTELKLSDSSLAFMTGVALALVYVAAGIPVALMADRANRTRIVTAALVVWSTATAICGLAQTYWQLLAARIGVGIGEAGGTAPSTSLLADKFPPARRPMALTIFALGMCLGAWLGSSVAGAVAELRGWRTAFLVLGLPGILLAPVVWLTVREPKRGVLDAKGGSTSVATLKSAATYMVHQRSARHLLIGAGLASFWSWGLMWWTPTFLQRSYGLTVGEAGQLLGPMHLVAGTAGTLLAAWLMSRRAATDPRYVTRIVAVLTAAATVPSVFLYWTDSLSVAKVLLWMFVPAVYLYIGPLLGLLQNVVPANMRATACAMLLFVTNLGNLIVAPQLVGIISDWLQHAHGAGHESLRWALLSMSPTGLWAAWHLWTCGRTVRRDAARIVSDVLGRAGEESKAGDPSLHCRLESGQ